MWRQAAGRCGRAWRPQAQPHGATQARWQSSVDPAEIERFRRLSSQWWDVSGPMKQLHYMNPPRMEWVANTIASELNREHRGTPTPLKGMKVLDVGCGGGIATESLGAMGAEAMGVDANGAAIEVATARLENESRHLAGNVSYRNCLAEDLLKEGGERFDAVVALEIIEHVNNPREFVRTLAGLLRPGGVLCMSTINKNTLSWGLGIVLAEYMLQAVPVGTHDYDKFITPEDMSAHLTAANILVTDIKGLTPMPDVQPLDKATGGAIPSKQLEIPCPTYNWTVTNNTAVNYLISGIRYKEPCFMRV